MKAAPRDRFRLVLHLGPLRAAFCFFPAKKFFLGGVIGDRSVYTNPLLISFRSKYGRGWFYGTAGARV